MTDKLLPARYVPILQRSEMRMYKTGKEYECYNEQLPAYLSSYSIATAFLIWQYYKFEVYSFVLDLWTISEFIHLGAFQAFHRLLAVRIVYFDSSRCPIFPYFSSPASDCTVWVVLLCAVSQLQVGIHARQQSWLVALRKFTIDIVNKDLSSS